MKILTKQLLTLFITLSLFGTLSQTSDAYAACVDVDGDGYGSPGDATCPNGSQTDCNDNNPAVNPGAAEICDGVDTNCDGAPLNFLDVDNDGDGVAWCAGDCNDNNPSTYPGATEICDGQDNDCLGGVPVIERDIDKDGISMCQGDCNDADASIYPGNIEICSDNKDNNCDGQTDETGCICPDSDGDTYTVSFCGGADCDDNNFAINPGVSESCSDGIDNDCNGLIDCSDSSCSTVPPCDACTDNDGDTFNAQGGVCGPLDCDDNDANVYPGAMEICDGKDSNCDGTTFGSDVDIDGDGIPWCGGDCDDNNPARFPGAFEICDDGIDNDCDNLTDLSDNYDCGPPTCRTETSPKDLPHLGTLLSSDGTEHPDNALLYCGKCHDANDFMGPQKDQCRRCHADPNDTSDPLNGVLKAQYPDPWPNGFGSAMNVEVHSSTIVGAKYGNWGMNCVTCHNPHSQEQNHKYRSTYGKLIKRTICFDNQATSESISGFVEFTGDTGSGSFADGPPHDENICEHCHTRTHHHRNTGDAPGDLDTNGNYVGHNDHKNCTTCHKHVDGFAPTGGSPAPPHDTQEFLNNCDYCHLDNGQGGFDFAAKIPNSKCEQCHTPAGALKPGFPAAPDVLAHVDTNGSGKYTYTNDCVDCHDPMFSQSNIKLIKKTLAGSLIPGSNIEFTVYSGTGSFADGPPFHENVCETCHSQTNHHHYDGNASADNGTSGYIGHNDSSDCTACHSHVNAFLPTLTPPPAPHDVFDCMVCHVTGDTYRFNADIPNTACESCHDAGAPNGSNGGSDIKVIEHYSNKYIDPLTGQLASLRCVECHNPMREQTNFRNNRNLAFVRSVIRGSNVAFEARTGKYSFAYDLSDRPADMSTENYVCNTCHTQTNHHQADGTASGGQRHNDGRNCTMCHQHNRGFLRTMGGGGMGGMR